MFRLFKKKKPEDETVDDANLESFEDSNEININNNLDSADDAVELEPEVVTEELDRQETSLTQETEPDLIVEEKSPEIEVLTSDQESTKEEPAKKEGLFKRLRSGLSKTSSSITEGMSALVLGKKKIDDDVLEDLETRLLMADVGMEATQRIIADLTQRSSRNELNDVDALMSALNDEMVKILKPVSKPLDLDDIEGPAVLLMVGINGAGKTTTIGKLAKQFQEEGLSVMLAAGDTFRAAAVEQLQVWGERNDIPVVAQGTGADSASVIYDAMESAKAKNIDILLADTAGRLHTQTNLMEELKKVKRVMQKINPDAPHEIMLIVDASIGQNALAQAKEFDAALGLTGITVTKLDGTAKGGILFAMAEKTGIPVRFIGVGESIDDLQEFDAYEFTGALLANEE